MAHVKPKHFWIRPRKLQIFIKKIFRVTEAAPKNNKRRNEASSAGNKKQMHCTSASGNIFTVYRHQSKDFNWCLRVVASIPCLNAIKRTQP
jgi:hypothetical protein